MLSIISKLIPPAIINTENAAVTGKVPEFFIEQKGSRIQLDTSS